MAGERRCRLPHAVITCPAARGRLRQGFGPGLCVTDAESDLPERQSGRRPAIQNVEFPFVEERHFGAPLALSTRIPAYPLRCVSRALNRRYFPIRGLWTPCPLSPGSLAFFTRPFTISVAPNRYLDRSDRRKPGFDANLGSFPVSQCRTIPRAA